MGYKYKAFISYSHKDRKWASWLHRRLENYTFPKTMRDVSAAAATIPKNLKPIFRDREELAAADNLGDKIEQALSASENLIIICSPDAAASHWVNQEVLYFKRHNRGAKIFSVIVDGEPFADGKEGAVECLPEALRFQLKKDGTLSKRPAEPLAADLRPQGDGKRLGTLKLISGMAGLGLDDLVQRDLTRARRRVTAITAGALATVLAMGTLTWTAIDARQEAEQRRNDAEGLMDFMVGDLRKRLEPVGRIDVLDGVASKALDYYKAQDASQLGCEERSRWGRAMILAAEVAVTRGDNKNFKAFSDDAFFLTQDNIKFCDDINSSIFDHSQAAFWSGYSSLLESDKDAAGEKFQLYKSLVLKLTNTAPENTLYREELAAAFVNLGAYHVSLSNYKKALLEFSDATEIYAHLIKENPNDEITARNYADTIGWQAKVYSQLGDLEASKENRLLELREADRILTTINPNDWKTQYIKYSSVRALARLEYLQENYAASIKYSKRCEKGFGVLLEHDQSNNKWKKGLALCLTLLSEALYQNKLIGEGDRIKDKLISTIEALPTNLELSEQKLKKELGI